MTIALILLFILLLPLMLGVGVVKGVLESLEYTTDDPNSTPNPTWIEVPVLQILQDQAQHPAEVAALTPTINNLQASAAKENTWAYPVALKDTDTFLDTAEQAEAEMTPVWLRVKPYGRAARIVGGVTGCLVRVDRNAMPQYGQLPMAIFAGGATGADPGDTMQIEAGS